MRQKYTLIVLLTLIVIFSNCNDKHLIQVVAIDRIDTSGIYISYDYLENNYSGHFDLYDIEEDFCTSDSLKIRIEINQPDKFEFVSVIERVWETEESIVSLKEGNENQVIYGYHNVDKKPLFEGANNEYENDSLIFVFFKRQSIQSNDFKKIGVYILINETGEVTLENAMTKNEEEIRLIKNLIDKLPSFTPPIYKGDSVVVSYLIEIPMYR